MKNLLLTFILLASFTLLNGMGAGAGADASGDWHKLAQHIVLTHAITDEALSGVEYVSYNDDGSLTTETRIAIIKNILKPNGKIGNHIELVDSDLDSNLPDRPHLHWAWNQLVQPNSGGNWENAFFAILEPMSSMENRAQEKLFGIAPYDSLQMGAHRLSPQSTLLIPSNLADSIRTYLVEYPGKIVTYDPATTSIRQAISNTLEQNYPETWHVADQYGKPLRNRTIRSRGGYTTKTYLQKTDGALIQIIHQDGLAPHIEDFKAIKDVRKKKYIGLHVDSPTISLEDDDYFKVLRKIFSHLAVPESDLRNHFGSSFSFLKACDFYNRMVQYDNQMGKKIARKYLRSALLADFCLRDGESLRLTPELLQAFPSWVGAEFLMQAAEALHSSNTDITRNNYLSTLNIVRKLFKWQQGFTTTPPTHSQAQNQLADFFQEEGRHADAIRCYLNNMDPSVDQPMQEAAAIKLSEFFDTDHWREFEARNKGAELTAKKARVLYTGAKSLQKKVQNITVTKHDRGITITTGKRYIRPEELERDPEIETNLKQCQWLYYLACKVALEIEKPGDNATTFMFGVPLVEAPCSSNTKLINQCLLGLSEITRITPRHSAPGVYARYHISELLRLGHYNSSTRWVDHNDEMVSDLEWYNNRATPREVHEQVFWSSKSRVLSVFNTATNGIDYLDDSLFLRGITDFMAQHYLANLDTFEDRPFASLGQLNESAKAAIAQRIKADPSMRYKRKITGPLDIDESNLSLEQVLLLSVVAKKQLHLKVEFPCSLPDRGKPCIETWIGRSTDVSSKKPHLQRAYQALSDDTKEKLSQFAQCRFVQ